MNNFHNYLTKYLVSSIPFIVIVTIWSSFRPEDNPNELTGITSLLWELLSWNLMIWFIALFYFFFALLASNSFRENILTKIARIKMRDEREVQITGRASRYSFLSTLSLLIVLLFLSMLNINLSELPKDKILKDGPSKSLSIGLKYHLFEKASVRKDSSFEPNNLFSFRKFPITKHGIILLIILWQIITYNYFARKELKVSDVLKTL